MKFDITLTEEEYENIFCRGHQELEIKLNGRIFKPSIFSRSVRKVGTPIVGTPYFSTESVYTFSGCVKDESDEELTQVKDEILKAKDAYEKAQNKLDKLLKRVRVEY